MKDWKINKLYLKVIGIAGAIALSFAGYMIVEGQSYKPVELIKSDSVNNSSQKQDNSALVKSPEVTPKPLMVQISGCVKQPGIYTMQEGQRVIDAIETAGGATSEIDDKSINLVAKVKDGQKIYFQPRKIDNPGKADTAASQEGKTPAKEVSAAAGERGAAVRDDAGAAKDGAAASEGKATKPAPGKININTASSVELQKLPGIGEYYANKIIEYRKAHGPFSEINSIIKVSGIGNARYEQIKSYITVN